MNDLNDRSVLRISDYEIIDDSVIVVDTLMAKTISALNKLGYKTKACCSGHYKGPYYSEQDNCDISFLEQVKNNQNCIILNQREDTFDYITKDVSTSIYIFFAENYSYLTLPDGFVWEDDYTIIRRIKYLDEKGQKRSGSAICTEIEKYNKILENWAMNLPVKKGND